MRIHLLSVPFTQTTPDFNICAFTTKVRRFATMMHSRGHEVILYAGDENTAECSELVTCITREDQDRLLGATEWWPKGEVQYAGWDPALPYWRLFHRRAEKALRERLQDRDFICIISGLAGDPIVKAFPNHLKVEFGIGYPGVHPDTWHVFESYAWMHAVYGQQGPASADGRWFDAVIPNYYDISEFPFSEKRGEYYLFMSRMIERKGYQIAIEACERYGARLVIAGKGGELPNHQCVEHIGFADTKRRGELLSHAQALFAPTIYLEPFGGVVAESMLCGTPVISTDWGAFPELVAHGRDGFRCRTMREFVGAMEAVRFLDKRVIRQAAQKRWSTDVVGGMYDEYFERLGTLWEDGFYQR